MTSKELIEILKKQPKDSVVKVYGSSADDGTGGLWVNGNRISI